ncbi:SPOR domain-containing protein [Halosquirtibacter xylanolyticus]|uniref:SPOR domain-containing protein n=1 Tax=Halosquirtibacter xylanolyticus TaxID=3374599 RepID=UPI003749FF56|nr:SPOR domain-containing protein [Prolixibacteraceae bacterium]
MKHTFWTMVLIGFAFTSCHSLKKASSEETQTVSTKAKAIPLTVKEEKVVAAKGEDSSVGNFKYYIIWGSFQHQENALKLKKQLIDEYQTQAFILVNEEGWFRVCFESYNKEKSARARIQELRDKYPNFETMWLLINKM